MGLTPFWRDRPVLVTGGTGLLGGWLVPALLDGGAAVVCVVRDWVPQAALARPPLADRVALVRGDVRDRSLVERVLAEYQVDTVFHLAAQTQVSVANRDPVSTLDSNVRGTWTVLEACRRSPTVRRVVVASSDKAYGETGALPYDERTPLEGRHPYDVSKACADLIAQAYFATYGLPVVITRCGNLYGGGDLNWGRLVPGTIRSALRGERPLLRSDGSPVRDYLYVEDGVAAYLTVAEALATRPELAGEAFNFGHARPVTVAELVREILTICGREDLEPEIVDGATGEIPAQWLNPDKARRVLAWTPAFDHRQGLTRAVAWYRKFLEEAGQDAG